MGEERLHKVLAHMGVASRRASEELIREGRVAVNGEVVTEQGFKVDPEHVTITVDGRPVRARTRPVYLALNKPRGYVTTAGADPLGRPTVLDLVRRPERLYPVGRLDVDTEGLLLLTNDGELAHRLMHPRYLVQKEYVAKVRGTPSPETLRRLRAGVATRFQPNPAPPHRVELIRSVPPDASLVKIVIHEGAKRQVRDMLEEVGHPTLSLRRSRIGPVVLGDLPRGQTRELTRDELAQLRQLVRLPADEQVGERHRPAGEYRRPAAVRPERAERPPRPAERPRPPFETERRRQPIERAEEGAALPRPRRPRWWESELDEHPPQYRTWHAPGAREAEQRAEPRPRPAAPRPPRREETARGGWQERRPRPAREAEYRPRQPRAAEGEGRPATYGTRSPRSGPAQPTARPYRAAPRQGPSSGGRGGEQRPWVQRRAGPEGGAPRPSGRPGQAPGMRGPGRGTRPGGASGNYQGRGPQTRGPQPRGPRPGPGYRGGGRRQSP